MRGTFGFFRGYEVLSLSGSGEQLFNLNTGRIAGDRQEYDVTMSAATPLTPGSEAGIANLKPNMTIKQEITMELLAD